MYFEPFELGSVLDANKSRKSLVTIEIGGQAVEIKADTGAEATVIPYHLYEKNYQEPTPADSAVFERAAWN